MSTAYTQAMLGNRQIMRRREELRACREKARRYAIADRWEPCDDCGTTKRETALLDGRMRGEVRLCEHCAEEGGLL